MLSSSINFKGKYYLTSDMHGKAVRMASLLYKISSDAKSKSDSEPTFLVDNGDMFIKNDHYAKDLLSDFIHKNKNIKTVCNLGNAEYFNLFNSDNKVYMNTIDALTKKGVTFISSPIEYLIKAKNIKDKRTENIKPYTIIQDKIDGKYKNILFLGTADIKSDILPVEKQAEILINIIKKAKKQYNPYKTILLSHNFIDNTKVILDKLNQSGIHDIEFVLGGHSHEIQDEKYKNSRIVHPGAMAKFAFISKLDNKGFHMANTDFDKQNKYDYTQIEKRYNPNVLSNLSNAIIDKLKHFKIFADTDYFKEICKVIHEIKNREYDKVSNPSEFGSLFATKLKELTNTDFAITISQDIRGDLPAVGNQLYQFNVDEVLDDNSPIYILKLTKNDIFNIFNTSLKEQHKNIMNLDFLEYSNNIRITRNPNIDDEHITSYETLGKLDSMRVVKIEMKDKTGKWKPLEDDKIYNVATYEYLAKGERPSLGYFKTIQNKYIYTPQLNPREVLTKAIKESQNGSKFLKSEMNDV